MDNSSEFLVEEILDSCFISHGHNHIEEFLVKWHGYNFLIATEDLLANFKKLS